MKLTSLIAGIVLATGIGVGAWILKGPGNSSATTFDPVGYFEQTASLEERIAALETAVAEERDARQTLEEALQILYAEIDALTEPAQEAEDAGEHRNAVAEYDRERVRELRARRESPDGRAEILVDGGFAPDRAAWIVRRESELRLDAMQARFDMVRSGGRPDPFDPALNPELALRQEIGDADYQRYLAANGRPTTVAVSNVLETSAGQAAGLQPGDEIVRYGGERVFSTFDLYRQTLQGDPGESVVVDIVRDGIQMQLVLPRGPIGVESRGARIRR